MKQKVAPVRYRTSNKKIQRIWVKIWDFVEQSLQKEKDDYIDTEEAEILRDELRRKF